MKFEITKKVKTPDGVEHDSVEAAHKHMWMRNLELLAAADLPQLQNAINAANTPENEIAEMGTKELRHAIREVFLAAWPRASKGQPRKPKEAASEAPKGGEGQPTVIDEHSAPEAERLEEPAQTAPKRNHGKKAA